MAGWLKLSRDINKHWIWKDPVKLKWWVDILLTVNFSDNKINIGNELYDCKRGQSIMSLKSWGERWNVSKDTVRNFFNLLEKDSMITHENLTKTTRITVCNYETYQSDLHDSQTQTERLTNDIRTQADPIKERKEDREKKERKKNIVVEPWRSDFKIYLSDLRNTYRLLINDDSWIKERERFNPNLDIKLTIEKSCTEFWATEAGWTHKKKSKSKDIDWKKTLTTAISQPQNKVYKQKGTNLFQSEGSKRREAAAELGKMAEKIVQNTVVDLTKV